MDSTYHQHQFVVAFASRATYISIPSLCQVSVTSDSISIDIMMQQHGRHATVSRIKTPKLVFSLIMFFLHPLLLFLLSTSVVALKHQASQPLHLSGIGKYAGPWYRRIPKRGCDLVSRIANFNHIFVHLTDIHTRMLSILVVMDL